MGCATADRRTEGALALAQEHRMSCDAAVPVRLYCRPPCTLHWEKLTVTIGVLVSKSICKRAEVVSYVTGYTSLGKELSFYYSLLP